MANQMIALGARAPQTNVLGPAIQQGAQMINMMRQQEALERQNAVAQQQMQLAQAKEQREASAAEIEMAGKQIDFYTKLAGQVMNPQGYQLLLGRLDKEAPEIAEAFRANLPPEQFDRNLMLQMVGSIGDNFKATYGPLETEVVQDQDGNYGVATTGGFSAERGQQGVAPLNVLRPKRAAATTAPSAAGGMGVPQSPAPAPGALRATRGVNTTPADLLQQGQPINRIPLGNPLRPMSYAGEAAQPDLGAVVQQMMETGVVSQSDFEAMRAAAGPDKDQQLADLLRSNNIQIMPNEEPAGGMRSAVYRPEEDAAMLQQTQAGGFEDTGVQFRGKPPMQSPLPGSAQVPLPRVRQETEAQTGTQERVKRLEKLRGEMPQAKGETSSLITNLTDRINAIDAFLRNPYRNSVIGAIEGRIPKALQSPTRADVQAQYDFIVSNSVLDKLIADRQQTETGASPQGIVSDRDLAIAASAANKLTQTGNERTQELEMQRLRDVLYRTRESALRRYNEVYREVLPEAPELRLRVPPVEPKYRAGATKPKPSPADVNALKRNRDNPDWTEGFRRQFGDEALRKALGGR